MWWRGSDTLRGCSIKMLWNSERPRDITHLVDFSLPYSKPYNRVKKVDTPLMDSRRNQPRNTHHQGSQQDTALFFFFPITGGLGGAYRRGCWISPQHRKTVQSLRKDAGFIFLCCVCVCVQTCRSGGWLGPSQLCGPAGWWCWGSAGTPLDMKSSFHPASPDTWGGDRDQRGETCCSTPSGGHSHSPL